MIYPSCFCSVVISCFLRHDCFQFWNALLFSSALGIFLQERGRVDLFKSQIILYFYTSSYYSFSQEHLPAGTADPSQPSPRRALLVCTSHIAVRAQPRKEAVGTSYIPAAGPCLSAASHSWRSWLQCPLTELTQVQASSARAFSVSMMRPEGII